MEVFKKKKNQWLKGWGGAFSLPMRLVLMEIRCMRWTEQAVIMTWVLLQQTGLAKPSFCFKFVGYVWSLTLWGVGIAWSMCVQSRVFMCVFHPFSFKGSSKVGSKPVIYLKTVLCILKVKKKEKQLWGMKNNFLGGGGGDYYDQQGQVKSCDCHVGEIKKEKENDEKHAASLIWWRSKTFCWCDVIIATQSQLLHFNLQLFFYVYFFYYRKPIQKRLDKKKENFDVFMQISYYPLLSPLNHFRVKVVVLCKLVIIIFYF